MSVQHVDDGADVLLQFDEVLLHLLGHEGALLACGPAVHVGEDADHVGAGLADESRFTGDLGEAAQLAANLVALLLRQVAEVVVEGCRQVQHGGDLVLKACGGDACRLQSRFHRVCGLLGHRVEVELRPRLEARREGGDEFRHAAAQRRVVVGQVGVAGEPDRRAVTLDEHGGVARLDDRDMRSGVAGRGGEELACHERPAPGCDRSEIEHR